LTYRRLITYVVTSKKKLEIDFRVLRPSFTLNLARRLARIVKKPALRMAHPHEKKMDHWGSLPLIKKGGKESHAVGPHPAWRNPLE
jgi:hypothetical protein